MTKTSSQKSSKTFPKLTRLGKPAQPDRYGTGDSPVGTILAAWQGPLLVRLHILPVGGEKYIHELFQDWGWTLPKKRDDKAASKFIAATLFPKKSWTGEFPSSLEIGFFGTDFQYEVMRQMMRVPRGKTISYGGLAQASKFPRAARAAGSVCARNPVPFLIPCHRIVGSNGNYGSYGYGTALKRQFLDWER